MPAHILDYLIQSAREKPDSIAFNYCTADTKKSITNLALLNASKSVAQQISKQYKPGERLLLVFPPGLDFIINLFACLYAGIIAVPVYPPDLRRKQHNLSMLRLISIIENSEPAAILCSKNMRMLLSKGKLVNLIKNFAFKAAIIKNHINTTKLHKLKIHNFNSKASIAPNIDIIYNELCYLQYTSGSTGDPKGVKISHANIINNTQNLAQRIKECGNTINSAVHWLPLYHDMGLINAVFYPLTIAIPSTITSPLEFIKDPSLWLNLISANKKVFSGGPNFSFALCTRKFHKTLNAPDLSNWEIAYTGAETIRPQTFTDFCNKFSEYGFNHKALSACYGLAEATLYAVGSPTGGIRSQRFIKNGNSLAQTDDNTAMEITNIGTCFPDHELIIVDPNTKNQVTDGTLGELWLHGPSVAQGYWRNPELTKQIFHAELNNSDKKFLRTGDLGFIYNENIYLYSRLKDILIFNGRSIAPDDIEWCLSSCDFIRPGGVVAFSADIDDKEQLIIAAELRDAKQADPELIANIRGIISRDCSLHTQKVILLQRNSIPRTSSGKVQRKLCAEQFNQNQLKSILAG